MTNKARNIYIDTTGFCDDALRRVNDAIERIQGESYDMSSMYEFEPIKAVDRDGFPLSRETPQDLLLFQYVGWRQVWLWELESLAGIR